MNRFLEALDEYIKARIAGADIEWPRAELEDAFRDEVKTIAEKVAENELNREFQRGEYDPDY